MGETRYGNGGKGHGRRMTDDQLVEKRKSLSPAEHDRKGKKAIKYEVGGALVSGAGLLAHQQGPSRAVRLAGAGAFGAGAATSIGAAAYRQHHSDEADRKRRAQVDRIIAERGKVGKAVSVKAALGGVPTRKTALQAGGLAAGAGLIGYGLTPQGRKKAREGKVASNLARSNPAYRSLPRAQRKEIAQQLISTYDQAKSGTVGKSRFYDPEHRRQRRLGAAEAALAAGGAAGLAFGGRGVLRTSRAAGKITSLQGVTARDTKAVPIVEDVLRRGSRKRHVPILAHGRHAGMLVGGAASAGGAAAINRHAESRRGRAWN